MSAIEGITVKGYFTLAAIYEEDARALGIFTPAFSQEKTEERTRLLEKAAHCRERAYDMLGVVTLNPSQKLVQRSLHEVGL